MPCLAPPLRSRPPSAKRRTLASTESRPNADGWLTTWRAAGLQPGLDERAQPVVMHLVEVQVTNIGDGACASAQTVVEPWSGLRRAMSSAIR